jgi:hypothetical protein
MGEDPLCPAPDAKRPESAPENSSLALVAALAALAKAVEAQTVHLSLLTDQLTDLCVNLTSMLDHLETRDDEPGHSTLS